MIQRSVFITMVTFVTTCNLLRAEKKDRPVVIQDMTFVQVESEIDKQLTPQRSCCYQACKLCSFCVPCIAGGINSIMISEDAGFDHNGQPVCSLDIFPLEPIAVGFAAGNLLMHLFDFFYRLNQREQQNEVNALKKDAWYKKMH